MGKRYGPLVGHGLVDDFFIPKVNKQTNDCREIKRSSVKMRLNLQWTFGLQ